MLAHSLAKPNRKAIQQDALLGRTRMQNIQAKEDVVVALWRKTTAPERIYGFLQIRTIARRKAKTVLLALLE